jgi:hypothetical protein
MDKSYRRPSLVWPLILIGAGVLFLLQNFNLLPPGTLAALIQLWPILLILLGLDMLIGRRSTLGAVVMLLIGVLVVAGALTWAALRANRLPLAQTQALIQSMREVDSATITLDFKVGDLTVSALNDSVYLMEGTAQNGSGESVQQRYAVAGSTGQLKLTQLQSALVIPFLAVNDPRTVWDIHLSPQLPLTLDVDTGVGRARLDLSELQLTELNLNTGVGQTEVIFPGAGAMRASLNTGVGEVTITLPENLPTRLTIDSGLTSVRVPSRFARSGDVYTTADFSTTEAYLELALDAGVGSVTVK